MAITQQRGGGGPRFNEDTVNVALIIGGVLVVIFFLLVIRLYFDQRAGKEIELKPERSPAKVLRRASLQS